MKKEKNLFKYFNFFFLQMIILLGGIVIFL